MYKTIKTLFWAIFLFAVLSLVFFTKPVQAADWSKRPILTVFVSAKTITSEETVAITALAATPVGEMVDQITITVDNQKEGCENTYYCRIYAGPFNVTKPTWVKYTAVAIKKGVGSEESGVTKVGYILVKPKTKDLTKPEYTKMITSANQLSVGDTLDLKILTKDKKGVAKIEIILDGQVVDICENETECGTTVGPFTEDQIGEHKYEFLVTNLAGNSIKPWGKFWVKALPVATPKPGTTSQGIKVSIVPDKTEALSTDKIIFSVSTEDDKQMKKIEILVNAKIVKVCENVEMCEFVGGPYPDYSGTFVSYGANAYDIVGRSIFSGYKWIKITKAANQSTDKDAPVVTIEGTLFTETGTFGYGADFVAKATDNSKIYKVEIYVTEDSTSQGGPAGICGASISPAVCETKLDYLAYGKKYVYWAEATDSQGNEGVSEKKSLTIPSLTGQNVEPTISITPSKSSLSTSDTVTFDAKVEVGSKVLDRLEILVNAYGVKTCYISTCSYTGGPYPERVDNAVSYAATAYFKDGTYKTTGYSNLFVKSSSNISTGSESGAITMTPYKSAVTNNEKVNFQIDVKTAAKPEKINLYVADELVFTCGSLTTCYYDGGPYLSPNNYYPYRPNYYAEAVYTNGNKMLSVKNNLTVSAGDSATGYQNDSIKPEVSITAESKYVGAQGSYAGGYDIKMTAKATDNSGSIAKINLYYSKVSNPSESPVWSCPKSSSPYTCVEQQGTLDYGTKYQYYAEAFDAAGNKAVSRMQYLDVSAR